MNTKGGFNMWSTVIPKKKLATLLFVLSMVLASAMPALAAGAPGDEGSEEVSRTASRGMQNMTLYLQNTTDSHYVFDYTTTYIFNTSLGNRSEFFGDTHTVTLTWDIHPVLAGNLTVQGDITVRIFMNTVGVSVNGNLQFILNELSYKQDVIMKTVVWTQTSQNTQVQVQSGVLMYSVILPGVDHTFAAGNSLELVFEISGGQSAYYGVWYGNATYDSRIELPCVDHLEVEEAFTLNYQDVPTVGFALNLTDQTVKVLANVTDPFGGYDIFSVNVTIIDPMGTVVVDNESMTLIAGFPTNFRCTYEYLWNFSGHPEGKYHVIVWAVDNNGHDYYYHRENYNYGNYWKTLELDFWVGGLPSNFFVKVVDSLDLPLEGAMVSAARAFGAVSNITDAQGMTGLALFPTLYTLEVYWEDVLVHTEAVTVTDGGQVELHVGVYYPTIRVVDANGDPLVGTSVMEIHPNGTVFLNPWVTDDNGTFNITRAPTGDYRFIVTWRDIQVADALVTIAANQVYTITAQVYKLTVIVQDSHGVALPGAQVVISEDVSTIVFDSKITNLQGQMRAQLPVGVFNIQVYWAEALVGEELDFIIDANKEVTIVCDVFYVAIKTVDSRDRPVSDAQVLILSNVTGSLLSSGRTNDLGIATLRLPAGTHKYQVYWRDIKVADGGGMAVTGDRPADNPYKIIVEVYYTSILVVDSRNNSLPGALVTVTSQNGGVFDFQQTNGSGMFEARVPKGTHVIIVQWKGVDVAQVNDFQVIGDIPYTAPFVVHAAVYYLTVKVVDSKDIPVSNALVDVHYMANELADAGVTGVNGEVTIRLAAQTYNLKVSWKEIEVGWLANKTLTGDETITMKVAIFYINYKALDSRQLPVKDAHITVMYTTGAVMDSGNTDTNGEVQMRLPGTIVDVSVVWKGTVVGGLDNDSVSADGLRVLNLKVYYLTVTVKGVDGSRIQKAMVTVTNMYGLTYDAGKTNKRGVAEFRVADGTYNVTARFTTTYMLSSVDESQTKTVTVTGDTPLAFKLKTYPPPIYTTVAFGVAMFVVVLLVIMLLVYFMLQRKLKQIEVAQVIRQEESVAEAVPVKDEKAVPEIKAAAPVVADVKKDAPSDTKGPPGPTEKKPTAQPVGPPQAKPGQPAQPAKPADVDAAIDKALKDLDSESEIK